LARKNTHSHKMLDAVSLGANQTSAETNVLNMDKAAILFEWSAGTVPVGDVTVEARLSKGGTYEILDIGGPVSVSGASGSHLIRLDELPFYSIRVVYTRASGTATATATIVIKQVGG
jgi:hypothetical protein